jgi:hypothetical protein
MASNDGTLQERYFDLLLERVSTDRYPSHQLLDRLEASFWSSEQVVAYVDFLLEKIDEAWYPSKQLMDRVQRLLAVTASAGSG